MADGTIGESSVLPVFQGPASLLKAIKEISPELERRAHEFEVNRALPPDLLKKILDTGIVRAIAPKELGGAEYSIPEIFPILEELARADGSTGWSFMVAASAPVMWERLDPAVVRPVFEARPGALSRFGARAMPGIVKKDGGLIVNGRWPLLSGSYKTDWVFVVGLISEPDGTPATNAQGGPDVRFICLPAADVTILDNWDSLGLRSTESNDAVVENKFVPEAWTFPFGKDNAEGSIIGRISLGFTTLPFHLSVVLGIARGMVDELVAIARTKRPFLKPTTFLADDPLFQYRLGSIETRLGVLRRVVVSASAEAWERSAAGEVIPQIEAVRFRSMTAYVHVELLAIANEIFGLAGTGVLYNPSSLQRRFRDMRSAAQHVVANPDAYGAFGAELVR